MNIKEENIDLYTDEFLLSSQERLKEQITKKLTDMGFHSIHVITEPDSEKRYIKIFYPDLGLYFFKKYGASQSSKKEDCLFKEELEAIKEFNNTLNFRIN